MDNNNAESTSSHSHLESQAPSQQPSLLTTEDAFCEQYFQQSTIRLESGEYTTSLPKKLSTQELGDSYNQALSRFISLENKLKKQPEIKKTVSSLYERVCRFKAHVDSYFYTNTG